MSWKEDAYWHIGLAKIFFHTKISSGTSLFGLVLFPGNRKEASLNQTSSSHFK
jgi:hypothetical protein